MKLAETGLTKEQFIELVKEVDAESFEGEIVGDVGSIENDSHPIEFDVEDEGKYQNITDVYGYQLADGSEVFLMKTCYRSGSYFTDYDYDGYELSVVEKHVELKEITSYH